MVALAEWFPLAVKLSFVGEGKGWGGIIAVVLAVVILVGSIYMLVASNYGARTGFHIVMVGLFGWMILLSLIWLVGAPGTDPGTGPRGREPAWVPFLAESEQGLEFKGALDEFPRGWDRVDQQNPRTYPGNIDAQGERNIVLETIAATMARYAQQQGWEATEPADWHLEDEQVPQRTAFHQEGTPLLFGVQYPATDAHPAVTVFAFRDKGLVFLPSLIFLVVSLVMFVLNIAMLARIENREKRRDETMGAPQPVTV